MRIFLKIKRKIAITVKADLGKEDYEERMVQILRMMIAESTARFEQLPCLVDVDILRNILYDGVWNRYNQIQSRIQEQNQAQMKKSKKSEEKK